MKITTEERARDLLRRWRLLDDAARNRQLALPRERRFDWVNRFIDMRDDEAAAFALPRDVWQAFAEARMRHERVVARRRRLGRWRG